MMSSFVQVNGLRLQGKMAQEKYVAAKLHEVNSNRRRYVLARRASKNDGVLYDHIAFVFQNPEFQFVTNRVDDELAYCLRLEQRPEYEIEEEVERLLRRFHLSAQRHLHPYQLSMGQKRRLSVAASVTDRHRILLLDEPTFGQDAKIRLRCSNGLKRIGNKERRLSW